MLSFFLFSVLYSIFPIPHSLFPEFLKHFHLLLRFDGAGTHRKGVQERVFVMKVPHIQQPFPEKVPIGS